MIMWRRAAAVLPGIGVSLLPKLTCPLCWPAYAAVLSAVGLGFLISTRYLFGITILFLALCTGALTYGAKQRRGYGPAALGALAAGVLLVGKFSFDSAVALYTGVVLLVAASLWNSWPRRREDACPGCPSEHHLIQASAKDTL